MLYFAIYAVIILAGIFLIGMIFHLLIQKKLNESNAILWLFIGLVVILAGIFPKVVIKLSHIFYITYPPAFVFTIAIIILLFIVLRHSIHISQLTAKIQEAATEISILKYELNEMKKQQDNLEQTNSTDKDGEGK